MTLHIRQAVYTDLFAIDALLRKGREESGEKFPNPEYPAALHVILNRITDRMIWIAYEEDEQGRAKLVGIMAMRLNAHEGAPSQNFLEVTHFYLLPEARSKSDANGKPAASTLIECAKQSSVAASAALQKWVPLMLGVNFGDRVELKEALIERHGFERTGSNYIRIPSEEDLPEELRQQNDAAPAEAAE